MISANLKGGWFDKLTRLITGFEDSESGESKPIAYKEHSQPEVIEDGVEDFDESEQKTFSSSSHNELEIMSDIDNLPQQKPYIALMVLTAAAMGFAHGSNDIANSVGPFR